MEFAYQIICFLSVFAQIVFSAEDFSKIDWCNSKYKCGSRTNIACEYKGDCGINPGCKTEELNTKEVSDAHNKLRNQFATGDTRSPKVKVANMMALSWDPGLAFLAKCNLKPCRNIMEHDKCRIFPPNFPTAGQNLAWMYFSNGNQIKCQEQIISKSIPSWYEEIKDMTPDEISERSKSFSMVKGKITGHFTQMVWAKITHVGCALIRKDADDGSVICNLACNYGPGGNLIGGEWFKQGEPASACPSETTKDSKYPGLCAPGSDSAIPPNSQGSATPSKPPGSQARSSAKLEQSGILILILYTVGACANTYY